MSVIWAILVGSVILLIVYGIVNGKIAEAKRIKAREESMRRKEDKILIGDKYDFHLRDGKILAAMVFEGPMTDAGSGTSGDWEGMIAMRNAGGKKVFIKRSFVRRVEEV